MRHLEVSANKINTADIHFYQPCTSSSLTTSSPSEACAWLLLCLSSLSAAASSSLASWSSSAFDSFLRMMMEACRRHVGYTNTKTLRSGCFKEWCMFVLNGLFFEFAEIKTSALESDAGVRLTAAGSWPCFECPARPSRPPQEQTTENQDGSHARPAWTQGSSGLPSSD